MSKFQRYLVGTLFQEEEQDKKTNLQNMKAKDPMGNTRWKGAFTGGFEAGYKNTCGSKEGWTPSHFVSSVSRKAETTERSIFDYMDKQDLGRQSVGQNIVLAAPFQPNKTEGYNITIQQSVGQKILSRLKKIEAHRTAPQNQQEMQKLFDIYAQEEGGKTEYLLRDLTAPLSVGAVAGSLEPDDFVDSYQDFYRKVIRQHSREETEEEIRKRREENRVYFDFTRPLEQEPEYLKEIQEVEELQRPKKRKKNLINQLCLKNIYAPAVTFREFRQSEALQPPPQDYDPFARMRGLQVLGKPKVEARGGLDAGKRSQMLGEVKLSSKFVSSQNSLANKFMSSERKTEEYAKVFADDRKNRRFQEYIQEMEGKKISSRLDHLAYEEAEAEREEFQQHYQQYLAKAKKEAPSANPDRTTSSKPFSIERTVEPWRPEKTLCKRFNVLTPYATTHHRRQQDSESYF